MGCKQCKEAAAMAEEHGQQLLGPPSKTMDASEHAQHLVYIVKPVLEMELVLQKLNELDAKQMITRTVGNDQGMMYYVKVHTSEEKWPWIFCKIYEPPTITGVSPVKLNGLKKMTEDYKLVTF